MYTRAFKTRNTEEFDTSVFVDCVKFNQHGDLFCISNSDSFKIVMLLSVCLMQTVCLYRSVLTNFHQTFIFLGKHSHILRV